jgi:hypothetical protein
MADRHGRLEHPDEGADSVFHEGKESEVLAEEASRPMGSRERGLFDSELTMTVARS